MKNYWAVWLLEDFVLGFGVDWGTKGTLAYWKEIQRYNNGDVLVSRGSKRTILFATDIKMNQKHSEPNWSYPTGLHFGIEEVGNLSWWKRRLNERKGINQKKEQIK